jgi:hypothetical protein
MQSRAGLVVAAIALALMAGVTIVQGRWTERWAERQDHLLEAAAKQLERTFPDSFGGWKLDRQIETSRAELDRAGAVGSVSRLYRHAKSRTPVSAFIVCASPHDASGHTPDRCYPGAGFQIAEPEHRETITLADGGVAEAYTGTFAKEGQTLRVFWTYGVSKQGDAEGDEAPETGSNAAAAPLEWVAPQIARIALNDFPAVYKLYAIIDQTKMPGSKAISECKDFIAELLPAFETARAADAGGPAAEPAGDAPAGETGANAG